MVSALLLFATSVPQDAAAVEAVIKQELERQGIPGLSVLVTKGGSVVLRAAYGKANIELGVPAVPENVYNVGSITKTFTALTVMSLVEEGKVALTDRASTWVSRSPESWAAITVRDLLAHTSGIPEYALVPGLGLTDEYTRETWWEKIGPMPLDFKTGSRFAYSNSNYTVLSELIEKASGKPYYEAVQERVIGKIGLKATKFRGSGEIVPLMATGYFKVGSELTVSPMEAVGSAFGAGGIVTTVDDLATFLGAVRDGAVVSKETLRAMQTPNRTSDGRKTVYGLGWFVRDLSGHPMVSHGGNTAGYSASMAYFPDEDLTVTLAGNVYAFGGDSLAILIARSIEPTLRPVSYVAKPDPDPELTKSLFAAFGALIEGRTESAVLDPDYRGQLESPRGRMGLGGFAQYRDYAGTEFLDRRAEEPDTVYLYRIRKGDVAFRVSFTVTKEKRVFAVSVAREA